MDYRAIDKQAAIDAAKLSNACIASHLCFSDLAKTIPPYLTAGNRQWYLPEHRIPTRLDLLPTWAQMLNNGLIDLESVEPMRAGDDPRVKPTDICVLDTIEQFLYMTWNGNWNVGVTFALGDLCFCSQVLGGTEFLVIKETTSFESISAGRILKDGGLSETVAAMLRATVEQCRTWTYMEAAA